MLKQRIDKTAEAAPPAKPDTFAVDEIVPSQRAHTGPNAVYQSTADTVDSDRHPVRLSLTNIDRDRLEDSKAAAGGQTHQERSGWRAQPPYGQKSAQRLHTFFNQRCQHREQQQGANNLDVIRR